MNVLIKSSVLLLPAGAIAAYLYVFPGDEGVDAIRSRSQPQEEICRRDGDRLAQLQAKPSLGEAVRFGGELQCLQLWPQVQAILDSLIPRSTAVSSLNEAASDTIPASEAAPATSEPRASETTSDDCEHDEQRLAELQAKPSLDEAVRLENEMQCLRLQPQLLAVLDKLIQAPQSIEAPSPNGAPSNTTSASEAAPPTSEPPASGATSAASDDVCKKDEQRVAAMPSAPPSRPGVIFVEENGDRPGVRLRKL